jgi:DHA1 family bicyclomycin/chloramphenicol resistance-like MFS transporter
MGHSNGKCRCTPDQMARYRGKLSGPFLDRIDLLIEVPALPAEALAGKADGESSATVRARVEQALAKQFARQNKPNSRLTAAKWIPAACQTKPAANCSSRPAPTSISRPAPGTASSRSPGPLPISPTARKSARRTLPKPSSTAVLPVDKSATARQPEKRSIAFLLAALSALGPFSIDTYLPSFHEIAEKLGATQLQVQQTLAAYLVAFAVMTLWHGAISDRFGRRRVILIALACFGLASAGCAVASSIEQLWFWRAMQGVTAGAGMVVSRAIVRDLYDGADAQRLMAQITMMFALAPAIAPVIGGWLQTFFGWRSVFAFLVLSTVALWFACWKLLPETLPPEKRQSLKPAYLGRTYWKVMSSPPFLFACAAISLNFGGFFVYVLSAPVFLMQHLGVHETGFLWLFGPAMAGMIGGSWLSGRLAGKISFSRTIALGYLLMAIAASCQPRPQPRTTASAAVERPAHLRLHPRHVAHHALPEHPGARPLPAQRGLAASCQSFFQSSFNTVIAALIAPALWGSTLSLAWGMAGMMAIGGIAALAHQKLGQQPK